MSSSSSSSSSSAPTNPIPSSSSSEITFLQTYGLLKSTPRTGWTRFPPLTFHPTYESTLQTQRVESVADHSGRLAIMGMLCTEPNIDQSKCVKMALVHDLAEAKVGDITPPTLSGISREDKIKLERDAMDVVLGSLSLGSHLASVEVRELWEEYEAQVSKEAIWVKDCDRVEMILQALEYEDGEEGLDLETFFESTVGKNRLTQTIGWDEEIRRRRRLMKEKRGVMKEERL